MKKLESEDIIKKDAKIVFDELQVNKIEFKSNIDDSFNDFRLSKKGQAGIYAIFCNNEIVYVGKTKNPRNRLRDHFIKPGKGTASKIAEITNLIQTGKTVEVSFVEVPITIYSSIEESIIEMTKPKKKNNLSLKKDNLSLNKKAS